MLETHRVEDSRKIPWGPPDTHSHCLSHSLLLRWRLYRYSPQMLLTQKLPQPQARGVDTTPPLRLQEPHPPTSWRLPGVQRGQGDILFQPLQGVAANMASRPSSLAPPDAAEGLPIAGTLHDHGPCSPGLLQSCCRSRCSAGAPVGTSLSQWSPWSFSFSYSPPWCHQPQATCPHFPLRWLQEALPHLQEMDSALGSLPAPEMCDSQVRRWVGAEPHHWNVGCVCVCCALVCLCVVYLCVHSHVCTHVHLCVHVCCVFMYALAHVYPCVLCARVCA